MKHARKALGLAIIVVISDLLSLFISHRLGLEDHWWSLLIAAVIAVTILLISNWYNPFRRISRLRRYAFGEISVYEGFWISEVSHGDRPYSISKIYYSPLLNRWACRGYALSYDHRLVASWKGVSIYFDPDSKFWFFKGVWYVHQAGSPHFMGPARDQFFKIKTNPGSPNRLTTIIVDNIDSVGDSSLDRHSQAEILMSNVRRVSSNDFEEAFHFVPNRIEDLAKCDEADFGKLIKRFFPERSQHPIEF